jgi:hypothetical protein
MRALACTRLAGYRVALVVLSGYSTREIRYFCAWLFHASPVSTHDRYP